MVELRHFLPRDLLYHHFGLYFKIGKAGGNHTIRLCDDIPGDKPGRTPL